MIQSSNQQFYHPLMLQPQIPPATPNQPSLLHQPNISSKTLHHSIDQQKFLSQSLITLAEFESQISLLESQLSPPPKLPEDTTINQSHFWFKRSTTNGQTIFNIESEYLQDSVFNNLDSIHQQEMEKIFIEAENEINRLTDILIERDREIVNIKEENNKILNESLLNTKDSDKHRREYQTLVQENKKLDNKVKELTGELSVIRNNDDGNRSRRVQVNGNSSISRVSSNRLSVVNDGNNSLTSSVVSSRLKQKRSIEIQTDNVAINSVNHLNINSLNTEKLEQELGNKIREINNLNNTLFTLNRQFETIKNDNYLLVEDIDNSKIKIDEMNQIIKVQNEHIDSLRVDSKKQQIKNKQIIDRVKQELRQQKLKHPPISTHTSTPIQPPVIQSTLASESKLISQLRSQISKLKNQISSIQSSNRSLTSKVDLLTSQNNKLSTELTTSKSQQNTNNTQLITLKTQNMNVSNELNRVKSQNQLLNSQKSQLQSQIRTMVTHQPNTDILKKNNEQLSATIKSLESRILLLSKTEQDNKELKDQLKKVGDKLSGKERQLNNQKIRFEQQLSKVKNEKQKRFNNTVDLSKDYEMIQERVEIMRNQMVLKNNMIQGLDRKIKQQEKIIEIYKNEFNSKNKGGIVGFGTSNSLTDKSPQRMLPPIESPEQLINVSKDLLNKGPKNDNSQDLYNILAMMTEQFEIMRNEYFNNPDVGLFINGEPYSSHQSSRSEHQSSNKVYQQQINSYVAALLNKISDHESQLDLYQQEINKLRFQLDNSSTYNQSFNNYRHQGQNDKNWEQLLSQLQFQRKLTEKLSDHVKSLKQEIQNLNQDIDEKNQQIYELSSKLYNNKHNLRQIDIHLGDVQNQYQRLLHHERSSHNKSVYNQPQSQTIRELIDQVQSYRQQLEKAVNLNEQLKGCLNQDGKVCMSCREYQILVEDLEMRLENYEKLMMGQLKRIFTSCQKEINRKERMTIHDRIQNLKERSANGRLNERSFEKFKAQQPPSIQKKAYIHRGERVNDYKNKGLDQLVNKQKLSLQTILFLMSKILEQVDNEEFHQLYDPILLEDITILKFDKANPENIDIQISQSRNGDLMKARNYLAPQLLKGAEPTRKSLIWNLGLIFHQIINKKPYFTRDTEIMDNNYPYRYENKVFPELRSIVEGMLEKQAGRRKILTQLRNIINNQLSRLRIMKARG